MKIISALIAASIPALGATLEVGSGKPYSTIGSALSAASTGDTVSVYSGTYSEYLTIADNSLTLTAAAGESPVIVGRVVLGATNATIRGMVITGWTNDNQGGIHTLSYSGLTVESCTITNPATSTGSGIYTRNAGNILIRSNLISRCSTGVNVNSATGTSYDDGTRIVGNLISSNSFDGIDMHGQWITVEGNSIWRNYDTNWVTTHPDGIQLIDSTIDGLRGCQNVKIVRNTIWSHPQGVFGGYYTTNLLVANNVVYNEAGVVAGVDLDAITTKGIALFSGSEVLIANNTIGRCASAGIYISYEASLSTGSMDIMQNIVDGLIGGAIGVYVVNSSDIGSWNRGLYGTLPYAARIASTYYSAAADLRAATAYEDNGIDGDPLMSNWMLLSGSPAIGAAEVLPEFSDDITGAIRTIPWDIGAYKYSGRSPFRATTARVGTIRSP